MARLVNFDQSGQGWDSLSRPGGSIRLEETCMRSPVRSLVPALIIGLALPVIAGTALPPSAAFPEWAPPLGLAGGGAEPSIRNAFDQKHAAYISAPTGLGSNFWYVDEIRNPDGSRSFKPSPPRQPDLGTG